MHEDLTSSGFEKKAGNIDLIYNSEIYIDMILGCVVGKFMYTTFCMLSILNLFVYYTM